MNQRVFTSRLCAAYAVTIGVVFTGCSLGGEVDLGREQALGGSAGAAEGGSAGNEGGWAGERDDGGAAGQEAGGAAGAVTGAGGASDGGTGGTSNPAGNGGGPSGCFLPASYNPNQPTHSGCACDVESDKPICAASGSFTCENGAWSFAASDCRFPDRCEDDDVSDGLVGCGCDPNLDYAAMCWRHHGLYCAPSGFWYTRASPSCESNCFSPTKNTDWALDEDALGCVCDPETDPDVCAEGAGFICTGGRWTATEDGPCWNHDMDCYSPTQNTDQAYADGAIGCACDRDIHDQIVCLDEVEAALVCTDDGHWEAIVDGCGSGGSTFE